MFLFVGVVVNYGVVVVNLVVYQVVWFIVVLIGGDDVVSFGVLLYGVKEVEGEGGCCCVINCIGGDVYCIVRF